MTREEFLARCANAFDAGLITPKRMRLMNRWLDVIMREGHSRVCDHREAEGESHQDQWEYVHDFWTRFGGEIGRLLQNSKGMERPGERYQPIATLANDTDGYALIQFAAILCHPCQKCATDPKAWWTRSAFCTHKNEVSDVLDSGQQGDMAQGPLPEQS